MFVYFLKMEDEVLIGIGSTIILELKVLYNDKDVDDLEEPSARKRKMHGE
jgi:hypothetical protein